MKELDMYLEQIIKLCKLYSVNNLFAFGSVLTDEFTRESDIDLVVEIGEKDPVLYADNYFNLKFQLERLLNRKIDLLEQKAIKNPFFKAQIDRKKVLIYAK